MSATKNSPKNSWISCIGIRVRNSYPANDSDHQITSIVFVRAGLCDLCVLNLVARELCLLWLRWYFISMDEEIFCRICLFHSDISQVVFLSYRRSSREYRDLCLEVDTIFVEENQWAWKQAEYKQSQNEWSERLSGGKGMLIRLCCLWAGLNLNHIGSWLAPTSIILISVVLSTVVGTSD